MLDMRGGVADQIHPLPDVAAQGTNLLWRSKSSFQKTIGVQSLQPLAIQYIAFAARYVLDMTGIDQLYLKSLALQDFKNGNPIDAGRFHNNSGDRTGDQPVCHALQIVGKTLEFPYRLLTRPFRHRHKMAPRADIDTSCMKVDVL